MIHTYTSEVYGTAQYIPIDKRHLKQPHSLYSASKIGADNIDLSFYNSFDLPLTVARPFNTYGPRQSARAIIPTIITQINGKKEIKLGDLRPPRNFNYVKGTCKGFLAAAEIDETISKEINIASNSKIPLKNMLELRKDIMKLDVKFITDGKRISSGKLEIFRLVGDNRLINEFGYKKIIRLKKD